MTAWRTMAGMAREPLQLRNAGNMIGVKIKDGVIRTRDGAWYYAGARATIETSGDIERRITATRLVVTGVLALAWRKKKDHRSLWLTIDGPGDTWQTVVEVDPGREATARRWVAQFNTLAAQR